MKKKKKAIPVLALGQRLEVTSDRATWRNTVTRVRYIHEQSRSGKHPNCRKIAEHFGLSTRTIERDLPAMRTIGMPLEYSAVRNGFYYTEEVPSDLPRPKLTSGEMLAFSLALRTLERFDERGAHGAQSRVPQKRDSLPHSMCRPSIQV